MPFGNPLPDVRLQVVRWDTPGVVREKDLMFSPIRNRRPELAVEDFAVRLKKYLGLAQLVFTRTKNLAKIFDFLVHAVQHLANCVDFHFSALEPIERKANRQVFRELHQHIFIRLRIGRARCKRGERLPEHVLHSARHLRHLVLEIPGACARLSRARRNPA